GKLQGFDQHMNLILDDADDISDMANEQKLGTIIVRGDNVIILSPPPR
ncbi:MAG: RNA-binding protein, partial [Candidatus Bathyarchaeota archaeon]